jgi:hypothetical protein
MEMEISFFSLDPASDESGLRRQDTGFCCLFASLDISMIYLQEANRWNLFALKKSVIENLSRRLDTNTPRKSRLYSTVASFSEIPSTRPSRTNDVNLPALTFHLHLFLFYCRASRGNIQVKILNPNRRKLFFPSRITKVGF